MWQRQRRRKPYRQRREAKAHFGELVQLDGSFHEWLEERGPRGCLRHMVDDATTEALECFSEEETIWAAVGVLRRWIEHYGVPRALYTDWKNVYVRPPNAEERASGEPAFTQFGRMCAKLGIGIIAASSPQAKGRVELAHGTHQDRLVEKLRLAGIRNYDQANAFLEKRYLAEHNHRYAHAAAAESDYHRRRPTARQLDEVFWLEEERVVSEDWVVRYHNRLLQLERQSRHWAPAKSRVLGGKMRLEKLPFTIAISVWASASERPLPRWAREGALPLPPRPLPRFDTGPHLRLIPGNKAG